MKGNFISRTLDSGFRRNDEQGSYRHIGESRYPEWPLFLLQDSIAETMVEGKTGQPAWDLDFLRKAGVEQRIDSWMQILMERPTREGKK